MAFAGYKLPVPEKVLTDRSGLVGYLGKKVIIGVRPSDFEDVSFTYASWPRLPATAGVTEELSSEIHVIFPIDTPLIAHPSIADASRDESDIGESGVTALAGGRSLWTARVSARSTVHPGDSLELAVDTSRIHFDLDTGLFIA